MSRLPDRDRADADLALLSPRPPLVIVAALGRNHAIGRAGALPWTMPGDLAHFRALTTGKPVVMGRRTWESIGRPLPDRDNIVVTRTPLDLPPGVARAADAESALDLASERAVARQAGCIVLIGGASLFAELMPRTARLYLTIVDLAPEADTFFPPIDPAEWRETGRRVPPRHPGDEARCSFVEYVRVSPLDS